MGWTTFRFHGSRMDFLMQEFNNEPTHGKVLKGAVVGSTIYAAYQLGEKHGARAGMVTALVILTSINNKEAYNFGYKDMDETVGPCEKKCPKSILNMLTPIEQLYPDAGTYNYASEWRKRCEEYHNKAKTKVKITPGTVIKLKEPLNFRSVGIKTDTFTNVGKNRWSIGETGYLTRFQAGRYEHEIIKQVS